jgi:hypothetical protein
MKLGTSLRIQTVNSDHHPIALGGLMIDVLFYVRDVERYRFDVGQTDESGMLVVTYDKLEAIRRENQKFSLMDYNTALDDCDDTIVVSVPSVTALRSRLESLEKWFPDEAPRLRQKLSLSANNETSSASCRVSIQDAGVHAVELVT